MTRVLSAMLALVLVVAPCRGLSPPVEGPVLAPFAPVGQYSGHWGIDYMVDPGTAVSAAAGGTVTFAGVVVGNRTVTVSHGGGLVTSYSYLSQINVVQGSTVSKGTVIARSGHAHGLEGLHFSVRRDGVYEDPIHWLSCPIRPEMGLVRLADYRSMSR